MQWITSYIGKLITLGQKIPLDVRFYITFPSNTDGECDTNDQYSLSTEDVQLGMKRINIQVCLMMANTLGRGSEFSFGDTSIRTDRRKTKGNEDEEDRNIYKVFHTEPESNHLTLANPSIIVGGYTTKTTTHDQMPHFDISLHENNTVSENPSLHGLLPPSTILIPLTADGRKVNIFSVGKDGKSIANKVHVGYGEMLVFKGDKHHGGVTYSCTDGDIKTDPALHLLLESRLHPNDEKHLNISTFDILNGDSQFEVYIKHLVWDDCKAVLDDYGNPGNMIIMAERLRRFGSNIVKEEIEKYITDYATQLQSIVQPQTTATRKSKRFKK